MARPRPLSAIGTRGRFAWMRDRQGATLPVANKIKLRWRRSTSAWAGPQRLLRELSYRRGISSATPLSLFEKDGQESDISGSDFADAAGLTEGGRSNGGEFLASFVPEATHIFNRGGRVLLLIWPVPRERWSPPAALRNLHISSRFPLAPRLRSKNRPADGSAGASRESRVAAIID